MSKQDRKNSSEKRYRRTLTGISGLVRILLLVLAAVILIFIGKSAYSLSHSIFYDSPMTDAANAQEVTVTVTDDMSVGDVGTMLKENGLIAEDGLVFEGKERLSDYHDKILPGTYILNTSMTVDEMLAILSQENTEGQPGTEEESEDS